MNKNTSGIFFLSHLENRLYNQNTLRLDHEIDRRILETAWKSALDDCPFFDQGLMEQDGALWFVPHASTCTAEDFSEDDLTGGMAIRSGDLAWAKVQGDRIRVGVSHALTDEWEKAFHLPSPLSLFPSGGSETLSTSVCERGGRNQSLGCGVGSHGGSDLSFTGQEAGNPNPQKVVCISGAPGRKKEGSGISDRCGCKGILYRNAPGVSHR